MIGFMPTEFFSKCGFDSQAGETAVCLETRVLAKGTWNVDIEIHLIFQLRFKS